MDLQSNLLKEKTIAVEIILDTPSNSSSGTAA
jgi:hypothetical protein